MSIVKLTANGKTVSVEVDDLLSDLHGSADCRANLIKVMAQRAVQRAE